MAQTLLRFLLDKLCPHRFSWPHNLHGRDYQICLICGTAYEYDCSAMRRTRRLGLAEHSGPEFGIR